MYDEMSVIMIMLAIALLINVVAVSQTRQCEITEIQDVINH